MVNKDFLKHLKPGDSVVTGRYNREKETGLRIRQVAKVTATQIVLGVDDRYKVDTGLRIGGFGGFIIRIATQADFDREEAERQKAQESRDQIAADEAHRKELADLFPVAIRPRVVGAPSGQPGYFNVEFYNVPEADIRNLAELLKSFGEN
jgi:hypothetical protein